MTSQNSPALSNHHYPRSHFSRIYKEEKEVKWREMIEYLEGVAIPTTKYHKTILEQFTLKDEILYYVKEATDGSIQYTLVVPHGLKQKAHEKSGHLGQKKSIKKVEELFCWCNLKVDVSNY